MRAMKRKTTYLKMVLLTEFREFYRKLRREAIIRRTRL